MGVVSDFNPQAERHIGNRQVCFDHRLFLANANFCDKRYQLTWHALSPSQRWTQQ